MSSKFYVVEKNGVPAVWQSDPKQNREHVEAQARFYEQLRATERHACGSPDQAPSALPKIPTFERIYERNLNPVNANTRD
jgi:hypothetical protein